MEDAKGKERRGEERRGKEKHFTEVRFPKIFHKLREVHEQVRKNLNKAHILRYRYLLK